MTANFRKDLSIGLNGFFCQGINELTALYATFPAPAFSNNGALDGNETADGDTGQDLIYQLAHTAASTFWILRKLYDFLCSPDLDGLMRYSKCPLYERCTVRPILEQDYICYNSPWEIVKGKTTIPCIYGRAAASMGLWQNSIDFDF